MIQQDCLMKTSKLEPNRPDFLSRLFKSAMLKSVPVDPEPHFDYSLMGWVAFVISVVLSVIFIAWYYKREAEKAKRALVSAQIHNSERATLIGNRKANLLNSSTLTQYHQICSDDEIDEDEVFVDEPYAYPVHQSKNSRRNSRMYVNRRIYPELSSAPLPRREVIYAGPRHSRSSRPALVPIDRNIIFPHLHKHAMNTSGLSEASDSTYASSRPLSYREIRPISKNTPIVASVLAAV